MSFFSRLYTPLYKNTGSVARDHLASERTFLAWMRTGLGFIALGIAIERFSQLDLTELLPAVRAPPPPRQSAEGGDGNRDAAAQDSHHPHRPTKFKEQSELIVSALLGTGTGSIVYGTSRYFVNLRLLERGLFKPAYHGPAILSVAVAGLAGGVYWSTVQSKEDRNRMTSNPN